MAWTDTEKRAAARYDNDLRHYRASLSRYARLLATEHCKRYPSQERITKYTGEVAYFKERIAELTGQNA